MSVLSRLFGRSAAKPAEEQCETYNGFRIYPIPRAEGQAFRIAARIEADLDGETKTHDFVRADTVGDRETAMAMSIRKARQVIDERGNALFR